jgi:hypothetical protein
MSVRLLCHGHRDRKKQEKEGGKQLMEKAVQRISGLPGIKAVYRNGELIYRYQEYQGNSGVKEDSVLRITRYENSNERI